MINKLSQVTLQPIDEDLPFTVETDASNFAIAATLNQNSKPVAFHAQTLYSLYQGGPTSALLWATFQNYSSLRASVG